MTTINQTRNNSLQQQLQSWDEQLQNILNTTDISQKQQGIDTFVRGFVPPDVTEEDILYYENNLLQDDEFFESLVREIHQCSTGERVEEIKGDQKRKATYILLPPPDAVTEGSSLDIVRELSFIATDREGSQWRAEA
eukprot:gene6639-7150_t